MGLSHLRVYESLKGVELVGVMDSDADRAANAARTYGCRVIDTLDEMASHAEAVSVAVPSSHHATTALPLLAAGISCLVEKPLALDETECLSLIDASESAGAVLMVGHIERFNPAVQELKKVLVGHDVHAVDVRRLNSVRRVTDVDVVLDLMVHDIDIVLDLLGSPIVGLTARGVHNTDSGGEDYVTSLLEFETGALASITASRITQNKVRRLEVTTSSHFITLDFTNQELVIYRQGNIAARPDGLMDIGNYVLELQAERVFVRNAEPLALELEHFVGMARTGGRPLVSGADALAALRVVWDIQRAVRAGRGETGSRVPKSLS